MSLLLLRRRLEAGLDCAPRVTEGIEDGGPSPAVSPARGSEPNSFENGALA